jgi:hypothetical protein
MKYILAINRTQFEPNSNTRNVLSGLEGVEFIYEINVLCSLIESEHTPAELLAHIRKSIEGVVAIFAVTSPFVFDVVSDFNQQVLKVRERVYQEEIADLQAKLAVRGL